MDWSRGVHPRGDSYPAPPGGYKRIVPPRPVPALRIAHGPGAGPTIDGGAQRPRPVITRITNDEAHAI